MEESSSELVKTSYRGLKIRNVKMRIDRCGVLGAFKKSNCLYPFCCFIPQGGYALQTDGAAAST